MKIKLLSMLLALTGLSACGALDPLILMQLLGGAPVTTEVRRAAIQDDRALRAAASTNNWRFQAPQMSPQQLRALPPPIVTDPAMR